MQSEYIESKVISLVSINQSLFLVHFERNGMDFIPGQHISVGLESDPSLMREYSIASGKDDKDLAILVREIPTGKLTPKLRKLRKGDRLLISKPRGFFTIDGDIPQESRVILLATGSGLAPFRSFVRTFPEQRFEVIHGVKKQEDSFQADFALPSSYTLCTSRDEVGNFKGRITEYLKEFEVKADDFYFLCGNGSMIHEVFTLLRAKGVDANHIMYEEYFNN